MVVQPLEPGSVGVSSSRRREGGGGVPGPRCTPPVQYVPLGPLETPGDPEAWSATTFSPCYLTSPPPPPPPRPHFHLIHLIPKQYISPFSSKNATYFMRVVWVQKVQVQMHACGSVSESQDHWEPGKVFSMSGKRLTGKYEGFNRCTIVGTSLCNNHNIVRHFNSLSILPTLSLLSIQWPLLVHEIVLTKFGR